MSYQRLAPLFILLLFSLFFIKSDHLNQFERTPASREEYQFDKRFIELSKEILTFKKLMMGPPEEPLPTPTLLPNGKKPVTFRDELKKLNFERIERIKKSGPFPFIKYSLEEIELKERKMLTVEEINLTPYYQKALLLRQKAVNLKEVVPQLERLTIDLLYYDNVTLVFNDFFSILSLYHLYDRAKWMKQIELPVNPSELSDISSIAIFLGHTEQTNLASILIADYKSELIIENGRYFIRPLPHFQVERDSIALLSAPTMNNYMTGMRLKSISTLLKKIYTFSSLSLGSHIVEIPRSCQEVSPTPLKSQTSFIALSKEEKSELVNNLIASFGLVSGSDLFRENFIDFEIPDLNDPQSLGFVGRLPFERYIQARKSMDYFKKRGELLGNLKVDSPPLIDDQIYFNQAIEEIAPNIEKAILKYRPELQDRYPELETLAKEILTFDERGINNYLAKMINDKVTLSNIVDAIGENKFASKKIEIKFPTIDSPLPYKLFALSELYEALNLKKSPRTEDHIKNACSIIKDPICLRDGNELKRLVELLSHFEKDSDLSITMLKVENEIKPYWPLLTSLWVFLSRDGAIAFPTEKIFLKNQLEINNRYAVLRLTYLHLKNQSRLFTEKPYLQNPVNAIFRILNLDFILLPFQANRFLDSSQMESLWGRVQKDLDQETGYLFRQKIPVSGRELYAELATINSTLISLLSDRDHATLFQKYDVPLVESDNAILALQNHTKIDKADLIPLLTRDLREHFFEVEDRQKGPLFFSLLKSAAISGKQRALEDLAHLCSLDIKNDKDLKELYLLTESDRNELMQNNRITPPEKLNSKIDSMTSSEWRILWFGLSSAAFFVGAVVLTSTGVLPVTAAILGTLGLGTQLGAVRIEIGEYFDSKERSERSRSFTELGMTGYETEERLHRSAFNSAMEIFFTIPMVGFAGRTIQSGSKVFYLRQSNLFKKISGKEFEKELNRELLHETELIYSKHLLGLQRLKVDKFSTLMMPRRLTLPSSEKEIKAAFAKSIIGEFQGSPIELKNFLTSFSSKRLEKAKATFKNIQETLSPQNSEQYGFIRKWWASFRKPNIEKYLQAEKSLLQTIDDLSTINDQKRFLTYVETNADSIASLLTGLPLRKREIPYSLMILGGPTSRVVIPPLSPLYQTIVGRRLGSSYLALVTELRRTRAKELLGISKRRSLGQNLQIYKGFKNSYYRLIGTAAEKEASILLTEFKGVEESIFQSASQYYRNFGESAAIRRLSDVELKTILFKPRNVKEISMQKELWESLPPEVFVKKIDKSKVALRVKDLSNYKSLSEAEDYLNAYKVLLIKENPEILGTL